MKDKIKKIIKEYKKQHKRDWLSFARGIMIGYSRDFPTYEEATLKDFDKWLNTTDNKNLIKLLEDNHD